MDFGAMHQDIVDSSDDGYWVFDLDGQTLYVNPAMARMYGAPREELDRLTILDTLDDDGKRQFRRHLADLRAGHRTERDVECLFVRHDGTRVWVLVGETLLHGPDGKVAAVAHRMSDYHQRRQLLDELTASRRALGEAQRIARLGSWNWDLEQGLITASESLHDLYGVPDPGEPVTPATFFDRVHPEDLPAMEGAVHRAIEDGEDISLVARVLSGEGEWLWVRARGVSHRDESGKVVALTGTHQDITEMRLAELALQDQVAQNLLMQAVATTANEARTLTDVLSRARSLILLHDDWRRCRAFVPDEHGTGVEPLHLFEQDRLDDDATPEESRRELALAQTCFRSKELAWDDTGLTIGFPILHADEVHAVLTITSDPPLYRYEMIENNARQTAVQLARVVERELAERELARARDAAMEASRQKSEFLARMSHEIRTPLNGVIGLNALLLRTELDAEQQRLASGVRTAGGTLLGLINDVLDFSKIEAGMLQLEYVHFDPADALDQAVDVLRESARSKGVAIEVTGDGTLPDRLVGDPTRLGQVLLNLGSNAIKFTSRGEVCFHAVAEDVDDRTRLHVEVSDTGIGLEGLDVEKLFESFAQGDASTTRMHGGTGLGLAISREIVGAFGGRIGARPRSGGGSVFWFTAMFDRAVEGHGRAPGARPDAPDVEALRVDGRAPRILVVEDNEVNQLVAVGLLEAFGCEATTAHDGIAALEALRRRRYDLVLMDVQMPRLDGYAATREVRRLEAAQGMAHVPVVAMTASAVEGERQRALDAGMDDFLTKPVDPRRLSHVVARWLSGPGGQTGDPSASTVSPGTGNLPDSHLDLRRLDMLGAMAAGDTSYLDRVIGRFVAADPDPIAPIRAAVAHADPAELREGAHRLAGGALNLGLPRVGAIARELEHLADRGTTAGAAEILPRLESAIEAGRAALLEYQQGYRSGS